MKRGLAGLFALVLVVAFCSCAQSKQSAVEGKLVDANGKPVAGVKITASQVQPIKGYEQAEAVTGADGGFRLTGLFPSSKYVIKPWSDKWTTEVSMTVETAPQGETSRLPKPMVIRFTVSAEGVISDNQTGLEWVVGPDRGMKYAEAVQWVAGCNVAGGGWRMPTRQQLKTLYQKGVGEWNRDPSFKTTGPCVWAEPRDSSSAWNFTFYNGNENWLYRDTSGNHRAFGVRSRPR